VQGTPDDTPFLTRSICQMSTVLRRSGRPALAVELFEWAAGRGALDAYSFCEFAECHLACGDSASALGVLLEALDVGLKSASLYLSLVKVCVLRHDRARAAQFVAAAERTGVLNQYMIALLLESHWRAGDLDAAEHVFARAQAMSAMTPDVFVTMIKVYGKMRRIRDAERVFNEATRAGLTTSRTLAALVSAYTAAGELKAVERIFAAALEQGTCDHRLYAAVIRAYGAALQPWHATRVFRQAQAAGFVNDWVIAAAVDADFRAGRYAEGRAKSRRS
jgi:pentatricopeptide repeat protein